MTTATFIAECMTAVGMGMAIDPEGMARRLVALADVEGNPKREGMLRRLASQVGACVPRPATKVTGKGRALRLSLGAHPRSETVPGCPCPECQVAHSQAEHDAARTAMLDARAITAAMQRAKPRRKARVKRPKVTPADVAFARYMTTPGVSYDTSRVVIRGRY